MGEFGLVELAADPRVVWSRALVVASMALFLGVVGHVSADGLLPAPGYLVVMFLFAVPMSVPFVRRPMGPVRLGVALVGGQTLTHLALTMSAGHVGDRPARVAVPPPTEAALPNVDGRRVGSLLDAYQSSPGIASHQTPTLPLHHLVSDLSAHAPMALAHLAVAALVALWLARGEQALWTLLALLGRRLVLARDLVVPALRPTARRVAASICTEVAPGPGWLVAPNSRRGPPLTI